MEMRLICMRFASNAACICTRSCRAAVRATENHSVERRYLRGHMVSRPRYNRDRTQRLPHFPTLQATYPADTNPNPTITWSTNQPSLLRLTPVQFTNKTSSLCPPAIGPSFGTAQLPPPAYNVYDHVNLGRRKIRFVSHVSRHPLR